MSSKELLVRVTLILMTCSSFGLAQGSELAAASDVDGQIILSASGLKKPLLVLLEHSGSNDKQRTFTDSRGNFEFRKVPKGSYTIRIPSEGFENVNHSFDVAGTPYVFVFLIGSAIWSRGPDAAGRSQIVDIRELRANIPKQALKEYEKAVREMKYNNTQRAIERLEKSIELAPDFYNAHLDLGQEYQKTGRLDAAEQELIGRSELNPHQGPPLIQLGEMYLDKNNFERAAQILLRAIQIAPGSAVAHYTLGRAFYQLSEYAEAEQAFTRAALLNKDLEAADLMLLQVYVRQGKASLALSQIDVLLHKSPGNSPNPTLEKFRSEVVVALANSKQSAEEQK